METDASHQIPDFDSWRGRVILFLLTAALRLAGFIMRIAEIAGWRPRDPAAELFGAGLR
jgi:hypothetical protein